MLERFYPDREAESVYEIDYEGLYHQGYRGVIFDIDNTLVPHGAPADERVMALFQRLYDMGYRTVLLSNNKEPRVKSFGEAVGSKYLFRAGKPGVAGYQKAMKQLETDRKTTIFVGDQLFTDILGAKNAGIVSYYVKPIHPKEEIQIVLKRMLERVVLYFYRRKQADKGE